MTLRIDVKENNERTILLLPYYNNKSLGVMPLIFKSKSDPAQNREEAIKASAEYINEQLLCRNIKYNIENIKRKLITAINEWNSSQIGLQFRIKDRIITVFYNGKRVGNFRVNIDDVRETLLLHGIDVCEVVCDVLEEELLDMGVKIHRSNIERKLKSVLTKKILRNGRSDEKDKKMLIEKIKKQAGLV